MATKKLVLTNDSKKNEVLLKERVKELEEEVSSLKKRLDDLRKAKNTTVLKREREVLEVGTPFGRRNSKPSVPDPKNAELQKQLDENDKKREKEMDELRKKFADEMEQLKKDQSNLPCGHEKEIESLRKQLADVMADNGALQVENADLKDRVNSLLTDLSVKEASWCDMEEKLKIEIQRSWAEKYRKWMAETEGKIQELQQTNMLLREYLKKKGGDPFEKSNGQGSSGS